MNKRITALLCAAGVLLAFLAGIALGAEIGPKRSRSVNAEGNDPYDGFVRTAEGTSPEMLTAGFWLDEHADELLFSAEEIEEFNRNNPLFVGYFSKEKRVEYHLYLYDLPDKVSHLAVHTLLEPDLVSGYASSETPVYINGELPEEGYWTALEENRALDRIPDSITPQYFISLDRIVARTVPSDDFASTSEKERHVNSFVSTEIVPFSGVAGIHESADGKWEYVIGGEFCGWVKKEMLAACADREEWLAACRPEQFLVVTGSELVMDETAYRTASGGMILPMGTKIRLSAEQPERLNGRNTQDSYVVEIPKRAKGGSLAWETTLVPVSKDVHVGYLTMTSGSVLEQAFKQLGRVYGYGGTLSSMDSPGFICRVYSCYGFELPRINWSIARMSDLGSFDCKAMTLARKSAVLEKMPAGTILYMEGQLMIYLGTSEGTPYVICSTMIRMRSQEDPEVTAKPNCILVCSLDTPRLSGSTWLQDISYILWKDY